MVSDGSIVGGSSAVSGYFKNKESHKDWVSQFDPLNPENLEQAKNAIRILTNEKAKLRKENDMLKAEIKEIENILYHLTDKAKRLLKRIRPKRDDAKSSK